MTYWRKLSCLTARVATNIIDIYESLSAVPGFCELSPEHQEEVNEVFERVTNSGGASLPVKMPEPAAVTSDENLSAPKANVTRAKDKKTAALQAKGEKKANPVVTKVAKAARAEMAAAAAKAAAEAKVTNAQASRAARAGKRSRGAD